MPKSKKQVEEELANARKDKKVVQETRANDLKSIVFGVFDDLNIAKDDLNYSYALNLIIPYTGNPMEFSLNKTHIRIILKGSESKFVKNHEKTPLWKAINEPEET